jgi:hypothetical protein
LLPGRPGTFEASCPEGDLAVEEVPEPVVPAAEFAGGPLLLPGWPAIPAPEFPGGTFRAPPGDLPCGEGDTPVGAVISVTAVTESGLMTIITGFPALSFARTKKELGRI